MKFSVIMLSSRGNELFDRAIRSVTNQNPDEFTVYIDRIVANWKDKKHMIDVLNNFVSKRPVNEDEVEVLSEPMYKKYIKTESGYLKIVTCKKRFQVSNFIRDHHANHIENFHKAILNSEHEWVMICDDDDEMIGNRREILSRYARADVGFLYGDVKVKFSDGSERIYENKQINSSEWSDPITTRIYGHSGTIYNREAFRQIHPFVDHGYFADWKICYWLLRCGWKAVHVPTILTIQNANPNPSPTRKVWYGKWDGIVQKLNSIPSEIIGVVK